MLLNVWIVHDVLHLCHVFRVLNVLIVMIVDIVKLVTSAKIATTAKNVLVAGVIVEDAKNVTTVFIALNLSIATTARIAQIFQMFQIIATMSR